MIYKEELLSGRSPRVRKAAKKILKDRIKGYGPLLHQALESEIEKPRAWETQKYLIYAMAATECVEEASYLKSLVKRDYEVLVLYQILSLAIVYLDIIDREDLSFLYESFQAENVACVIGGCAAVYMTQIVLEDDDFYKIMAHVTQPPYLEQVGKTTNPFVFILAASYLFPAYNRDKILAFARQFDVQLVRDIVSDVEKGKDGKRINYF